MEQLNVPNREDFELLAVEVSINAIVWYEPRSPCSPRLIVSIKSGGMVIEFEGGEERIQSCLSPDQHRTYNTAF